MTEAAIAALLPRDRALPAQGTVRLERIARAHGLSLHSLENGAIIAMRGPAAIGASFAVAGQVFAHGGERALDLGRVGVRLGREAYLSADDDVWGDYLTISGFKERCTSIVGRAPFGNLPCFWMECDDCVIVATSPRLLEELAPDRPRVDWRALATYLVAPEMRTASTCLEGVRELPGGCLLEVARKAITLRAHWSPWEFAGSDDPVDDLGEAVSVVGSAVNRAIAARCNQVSQRVLLLSGGLDSSTIAAALAGSGRRFSSLTMVTRQRSGDERIYARAVATATGSSLTEVARSTAEIDWEDQTPRGLARPSARLFRQPTLAAAQRLAEQTGASAILDGGGGDNVFCSLQSVAPLLDRIAVEGIGRGAWATTREIALRAGVSLGAVLTAAASRRVRGRVAFRWPTDPSFLSDGAGALAEDASRHPWLDPPAGALPGQAAHVALILGAIGLSEDHCTRAGLRTVSPLVAQPIVEAALRVRSWLWLENGRNRAVIRRALAGRLPSAVVTRSGKGTPAGFMGEIVEDHRERLRDLLLDGLLVANGVADRVEIEAELGSSAMARGNRFSRLLVIADAERWARLWS